MRRFAAILVGVLLAACGTAPPSDQPAPPAVAQARDRLFALTVWADHSTYRPDEPIRISAEVTYLGPNATTIHHAASPVGWSIQQLDGIAVMGGGMDTPCLFTEIQAGRPLSVPFSKSGVVNDTGPFDRAWFADPTIRLPAGRWRFTADMSHYLGGCGGEEHRLQVSVDLPVVP